MARVHTVQKAQKKQGTCRKCGAKIKKGDKYFWWKNRLGRFSMRKVQCAKHYPRASDLTTSDKLSRLYAAQEGVEDVLAQGEWGKDDIVDALDNAASEARDVAQEYRDSIDNMPENLQQSSVADDINEKADNVEAWADELESARDEIEDEIEELPDDEKKEIDEDYKSEQEGLDEEDRDSAEEAESILEDRYQDKLDELVSEWRANVESIVEGVLGNLSV